MATDKTEVDGLKSPERRSLLSAAGRFAIVTPPAVTFLLSTSLDSDAVAASSNIRDHRRQRIIRWRAWRRRRP